MQLSKYKELNLIKVFILPPNLKSLEERLKLRNQDDKATIKKRLIQYKIDRKYWYNYDHILINDNLDNCFRQIEKIIEDNKEIIIIKFFFIIPLLFDSIFSSEISDGRKVKSINQVFFQCLNFTEYFSYHFVFIIFLLVEKNKFVIFSRLFKISNLGFNFPKFKYNYSRINFWFWVKNSF